MCGDALRGLACALRTAMRLLLGARLALLRIRALPLLMMLWRALTTGSLRLAALRCGAAVLLGLGAVVFLVRRSGGACLPARGRAPVYLMTLGGAIGGHLPTTVRVAFVHEVPSYRLWEHGTKARCHQDEWASCIP